MMATIDQINDDSRSPFAVSSGEQVDDGDVDVDVNGDEDGDDDDFFRSPFAELKNKFNRTAASSNIAISTKVKTTFYPVFYWF